MVGAALVRRLAGEGCDLVTVDRRELDLRRQAEVEDWMARERPDAVFMAAATVGGINANHTRPAEFIYDNLAIEANVIHAAMRCGVEKLLFLGSSCVYPRLAAQPMTEDCLLSGPLEPTNQWYATAKIAGIKMCQAYRQQYGCDFIAAMPTNLYGPGDNFDPENSHVLPALLLRIHQAKTAGRESVEIWGTGDPRREFLFVDDLADALVFLMQRYSGQIQINVGTGREITIRDLAALIAGVIGYEGEFHFNPDRPDGTPRKLLDTGRLTAMGWGAKTGLGAGVEQTWRWYLERPTEVRGIAAAG
jgi:GDP-L-fucose synthase